MRSRLIFSLMVSLQISAQPTNPFVQAGECSFSEHDSTFSVLSSDRAILHWDSFSIQAGEITEFIQPSSQSIVLNRVTGSSASEILGNLHSNGHVILINPLGLYIGENGYIETAGFTGATLDIRDQDFLRGQELFFAGESGAKIVNLGRIESRFGDLFLISRKIENKGALLAENGTVGLGAGAKVLLVPTGDRRITIEIGNGSIEDEGTISALVIELGAKNPYELAIQTKGRLEAFEKEERNGRIYLVAEEGRTRVQGMLLAKGGEVQVLGTEVLLDEGSFIDVSSPHRGGSVFVGGDYQGSNPFIKNADFTTVTPSARIDAQARERGEGGRVIVWANRVAKFSGEIDVCGGPKGGDGGFVEVSGLERFYYDGRCDRRALFGKVGTLLLDPESNITINAAGPDSGGSFTGGIYTPSTSPSVITTATLVSELGLGNVVINTAYVGAGGGSGDVTVSNNFSWSTANTLTINCARTFSIGAGITVSSTSTGNFNALTVNANSSGVTTGAFSGVVVNAGGKITSVGGHLTLNGIGGFSGATSNGVRILGEVSTLDGTITLTGTGKSNGGSSDGVRVLSGGKVRATGLGSIVATGTGSSTGSANSGIIVTGTSSSIDTQGGNITLTGSVISTSNCTGLSVASGGNISTLTGIITGNGTTAGGSSSNRGILVSGLNSLITAGDGAINLTGVGGSSSFGQGVLISSSGKVTSTGSTSSAATISLDGSHPTVGASACYGVQVVTTGSSVLSNSGNIFIKGRSRGATDQNDGVIVSSSALISSTGVGPNAATITLDGQSIGLTGASARGVFIVSSAIVESVDGDITFIGQGGGSTDLLHGIAIASTGTIIRSTGTGSDAAKITMTGVGGSGTGTCNGIFLSTSPLIESKDGAISLTGTGAGTTTGHGVSMVISSLVRSTNSAPITIIGTGTANGTLANGVDMDASSVEAKDGAIILTGTGRGTSTGHGISLANTSSVKSTSSAPITISGSGTASGTSANGLDMTGLSRIETLNGAVTITGTGKGSSGAQGVQINNATLSSTGSGKFELTGDTLASGNTSNGIFVNNGGKIQSSGTGTLSLDGTGGANGAASYGIQVANLTTSINSNSGSITLIGRDTGGSERGILITSSAVVKSNVSAAINVSTFSDMDMTEGGQIIGGSGPVQLSISRDLNITGGSGASLISGILLGDGSLTASIDRNLTLLGGTGASSHAQIGSRNSSSTANIHFTFVGGDATVDGHDLASFALMGHGNETLGGPTYSGAISFDEVGSDLTVVGANQGVGSFGFGQIGHLNNVGSTVSGNISAAVDGSILVTSGSAGTTARACIGHGGSGAPNVNAALDLSASIDMNLSQGGQVIGGLGSVELTILQDLTITGGSEADRISGVLLGDGSLTALVGRDLTLQGGTGASSHAQIGSRNSSSSANIDFTSIGGDATVDGHDLASFALIGHGNETLVGTTYSGTISLDEIGNNLSVIGANQGTGGFGFGQIGHLNDAGSTISGNINALAEGSILVVGGSAGATARACIGHGGSGAPNVNAALDLSASIDMNLSQGGQVIGGSGSLQLTILQDLTIIGGNEADYISGVLLGDGSLTALVGRDLTLQGGIGASSHAQIGSRNSSSTANIDFTSIGGDASVDGHDLASFALIGHGNETLVGTTYSGTISLDEIGNNLSVIGANQGAGGFGFGQIGHRNSAGSTLSGNINALTGGSILVSGGSAGATARARIGHGGNGALGTFGDIKMLLVANQNFEMFSFVGAGAAKVVNKSQLAGSGNLTIVVDNKFPNFPTFGSGAFTLNSTLKAGGELRIYTVQPSQNAINDLINGQPFVAAPFNENTLDQQYNIYFSDGTYTGIAFMIYYKLGGFIQIIAVEALQTTEAELQNSLPIFRYMRLPTYPWHHPSFCNYERCDPGFDPYGSFIFEDDVYWTAENFVSQN